MDRCEYERDLRRRQAEHLAKLRLNPTHPSLLPWKPCQHDACTECIGTGIKADGQPCVHGIACQCPKCSPYSMTA